MSVINWNASTPNSLEPDYPVVSSEIKDVKNQLDPNNSEHSELLIISLRKELIKDFS